MAKKMKLPMFVIPHGVTWADYFAEPVSSVVVKPIADEEGWEIVGKPKPKAVAEAVAEAKPLGGANGAPPAPKVSKFWCRDGNACPWYNCPFRHEACTFGPLCRSFERDPESNKCVAEGGCKFDHRDKTKLRKYVKAITTNTEKEIWENFYLKGLDAVMPYVFDATAMTREDRHLMVRSLAESVLEGNLRFRYGTSMVGYTEHKWFWIDAP